MKTTVGELLKSCKSGEVDLSPESIKELESLGLNRNLSVTTKDGSTYIDILPSAIVFG